jgi:hypothetical protein
MRDFEDFGLFKNGRWFIASGYDFAAPRFAAEKGPFCASKAHYLLVASRRHLIAVPNTI